MRRHMRIIAVFLSALLVLTSFSGCLHIRRIQQDGSETTADPVPSGGGQDTPETKGSGPETEAPGSPSPEPEPEPEPDPDPQPTDVPAPDAPPVIDFTYDDLYRANSAKKLLASYDTVLAYGGTEDDAWSSSFWMYDDELVMYNENTYFYTDDAGEVVNGYFASGLYRGFSFSVDGDVGVVTLSVPYVEEDGQWIREQADSFIQRYLPAVPEGEPELIGWSEDTYTVNVKEMLYLDEENSAPCDNRVTVDRKTLAIRQLEWEYQIDDNVYYGSMGVEYNGDRRGTDVLAAWEGQRLIRIESVTAEGAATYEFPFAGLWELDLFNQEGLYISTSADMPGSDRLAIGTGTEEVTVWLRDEANLPIDTAEEDTGWDAEALGFTFEQIRNANRITNLVRQYGTVGMEEREPYGVYNDVFFKDRDSIARYTESVYTSDEGSETVVQGSGRGLDYVIMGTGVLASAWIGDDYAIPPEEIGYGDNGEFYEGDLSIACYLMNGKTEIVSSAEDALVFRVTSTFSEDTDPVVYEYTIDPGTLRLKEFTPVGSDAVFRVSVEGEPRYAPQFVEAFGETRTVVYHTMLDGVEKDYTFTVPSSWSFMLGLPSEAEFTLDREGLIPTENQVPPDGKDYEIWVSNAVG